MSAADSARRPLAPGGPWLSTASAGLGGASPSRRLKLPQRRSEHLLEGGLVAHLSADGLQCPAGFVFAEPEIYQADPGVGEARRFGRPRARAASLRRDLGDPGAESALGLELIVSSTEQPEIAHRRRATHRSRNDVVELQPGCRAAAGAVVGHERTAIPIPRGDLAPRPGGDGAGGIGGLLAVRPGIVGGCKLALLGLFDDQIEPAFEDLGHIAVGDAVPQKVLGLAQLVVNLGRDRDLQRVSPGRQRLDPCRRRSRPRAIDHWFREELRVVHLGDPRRNVGPGCLGRHELRDPAFALACRRVEQAFDVVVVDDRAE